MPENAAILGKMVIPEIAADNAWHLTQDNKERTVSGYDTTRINPFWKRMDASIWDSFLNVRNNCQESKGIV
jgi:hypothetical protein